MAFLYVFQSSLFSKSSKLLNTVSETFMYSTFTGEVTSKDSAVTVKLLFVHKPKVSVEITLSHLFPSTSTVSSGTLVSTVKFSGVTESPVFTVSHSLPASSVYFSTLNL